MKLMHKLRSTRGETLAEILVSIVILGLSIGLLLTMVMTSTKITQSARTADEQLMKELNDADAHMNKDDPATITISDGSTTVTIDEGYYLYRSEDGALVSYGK